MVTWLVPAVMIPEKVPPRLPVPVFTDNCTGVLEVTFCGTSELSTAFTITLNGAATIGDAPALTETTFSFTGGGHLFGEDYSFTYENDNFGGDGGDRFRTVGLQVQVGDFSAGFNVFTGDPGMDDRNDYVLKGEGMGPNGTYTGHTSDKWRMGAAYVGYQNYRAGWNSEGVRNVIQNKMHDWLDIPRFRVLPIEGSFYGGYFTKNRYTTW